MADSPVPPHLQAATIDDLLRASLAELCELGGWPVSAGLDAVELPEISGDGARIAQVLDNFVSNAVKFTPQGGRVTIRTAQTELGVAIDFVDTGIGIPVRSCRSSSSGSSAHVRQTRRRFREPGSASRSRARSSRGTEAP